MQRRLPDNCVTRPETGRSRGHRNSCCNVRVFHVEEGETRGAGTAPSDEQSSDMRTGLGAVPL